MLIHSQANNKMKKEKYIMMFGVIFVLGLIGIVSSVGISQVYHNENPVLVSPGEIRTIEFGKLMASQETNDRIMEVEVIEGMEIAIPVSERINVPAGSIDKGVDLKISIPDNAEIGQEYVISVRIKDVTPSESQGMVGFSDSMTGSIPVIVQEKESPEKLNLTWILAGVFVLIIAVVIIVYLISARKHTSLRDVKTR